MESLGMQLGGSSAGISLPAPRKRPAPDSDLRDADDVSEQDSGSSSDQPINTVPQACERFVFDLAAIGPMISVRALRAKQSRQSAAAVLSPANSSWLSKPAVDGSESKQAVSDAMDVDPPPAQPDDGEDSDSSSQPEEQTSLGYDSEDSFIDDSELVEDVRPTGFFQASSDAAVLQKLQAVHTIKKSGKSGGSAGGGGGGTQGAGAAGSKSKSAKPMPNITLPEPVRAALDEALQLAKTRGDMLQPRDLESPLEVKPKRLPVEYHDLLLKLGAAVDASTIPLSKRPLVGRKFAEATGFSVKVVRTRMKRKEPAVADLQTQIDALLAQLRDRVKKDVDLHNRRVQELAAKEPAATLSTPSPSTNASSSPMETDSGAPAGPSQAPDASSTGVAAAAGLKPEGKGAPKVKDETKYRAKWELFTPLLIQITDLRATLFATQHKDADAAAKEKDRVSLYQLIRDYWPRSCGITTSHLTKAYERHAKKQGDTQAAARDDTSGAGQPATVKPLPKGPTPKKSAAPSDSAAGSKSSKAGSSKGKAPPIAIKDTPAPSTQSGLMSPNRGGAAAGKVANTGAIASDATQAGAGIGTVNPTGGLSAFEWIASMKPIDPAQYPRKGYLFGTLPDDPWGPDHFSKL